MELYVTCPCRNVKLTTHLHLVPRSKNEWSYTFTPPIRLHDVVLLKKKHRDSFIHAHSMVLSRGATAPLFISYNQILRYSH
jgi:hypothetical protein